MHGQDQTPVTLQEGRYLASNGDFDRYTSMVIVMGGTCFAMLSGNAVDEHGARTQWSALLPAGLHACCDEYEANEISSIVITDGIGAEFGDPGAGH
jgi:hypothetical protein